MAVTRLYIQNVAPGYTPSAYRGSWNNTGVINKKLDITKSGAVGNTSEYYNFVGSYGRARAMYGPIAAGTYTIDSLCLPVAVSTTTTVDYLRTHIFIESTGGVLRGTILANFNDTSFDLPAAATAGHVSDTSASSNEVEAQAGDYLVVEYGIAHMVAGINQFYAYYGGTNATDLYNGASIATYTGWVDLNETGSALPPGTPTLANSGWDENVLVYLTATPGAGPTPTGYKFYRDGVLAETQVSNVYHIPVGQGGAVNWTCTAHNGVGDSSASNAVAANAIPPILTGLGAPTYYRTIADSHTFAVSITGHASNYEFYIDDVLEQSSASNQYVAESPARAVLGAIGQNGYGNSNELTASFELWKVLEAAPSPSMHDEILADWTILQNDYFFTDLSRLYFAQPGSRLCSTPDGNALVGNGTNYEFIQTWLSHDKTEDFSAEGEILFDFAFNTGLFDSAPFLCYPDEVVYSHECRPADIGHARLMYDVRPGYPRRNNGAALMFGSTEWYYKWVKVGYDYRYNGGAPRINSWVEIDGTRRYTGEIEFSPDVNFPHPIVGMHRWRGASGDRIIALKNYRITTGNIAALSFSTNRIAGLMWYYTIKANGLHNWTADGDNYWVSGNIKVYKYADSLGSCYLTAGANEYIETPLIHVPSSRIPKNCQIRAKFVDWQVRDSEGAVLLSGSVGSTEVVTTVDISELQVGTFSLRLILKDTTSMIRWFDVSWSSIPQILTIDQSSTARILSVSNNTQSATARMLGNASKTQSALARIATSNTAGMMMGMNF